MGRGGKKPQKISSVQNESPKQGQRKSAKGSPAIAGYFDNRKNLAEKLAEKSYFTQYMETPHFPKEELFLYIAPMIMTHTQGGVVSEKLFEEMFENIKKYIAEENPEARQAVVEPADSATNPGADFYALEKGEKIGISFKSEASGKLSEKSGRVAKFLESSNGVGGINSQEDALEYTTSVLEHMDNYKYIYFLRVQKDPQNHRVFYRMHQIPYQALRDGISRLEKEDFTELKDGIQRTSAFVKNDSGEAFAKMIFDKSGNKVTLEQIDMAQCPTIAEWEIKTEPDFFN